MAATKADITAATATHAGESDPHTGYVKEADANYVDLTDGGATALHSHAGGGAPDTADYLVGTAQGGLSAEIVVGTSPGGELGGTWASPTVDATHSGTSHAGVISTHEAAGDPHTGYVREADANWVDLTDAGATTLHRHPGGVVTDPALWYAAAGYEFWFVPGHVDIVVVQAATNRGLSGAGWTGAVAANAAVTEGSSGDFLSAADIDPTRIVIGSTNTQLASPRIFGSYDHGLQASRFLGSMPTKLCTEFYARFAVASANENTSFIGFHTPAGTDITAAGGAAAIMSDATNFRLKSDAGDDAGAAIDTAWHTFRIEVGSSTTEWFIDAVSQGTITTEADIWPTSWRIASGTTNRPQVSWARVYYS